MRTLEIPNLPDEVYQQIEKLARLRGRSVVEQATEFLSRGLAADEAREANLLAEIRADREATARRRMFVTDDNLNEAKNWGRK